MDNKAPEIRIKNFSGKWYEVALSSVIDVRSGKDYKHLGKGNIPVYGTGGYMLSVDSALSNDEDAIGIGRKGTIDKPCILRAPFWTVDTLFYAVPFPGFNLDFLFCLFQKIEWKKHDESTGVPSLSKIAINNVPVYATNELEQTAIGNYFQKLDILINQHQQKHDKLSSIKKAMLEKMFPKQGETVPEIRFKGFCGEWVERSWNDTVDISTNMVDPRNCQYGELFHVGPGNIESFTGRFYNNVLKVKESNLISGKFHFNKGDIIYGKINPQLAKYVIAPFEGLASADAYVLNTKNGVIQNYLFAILHTEDFYKYTVSVSSRTGMPKINRDELNVYSYMAPSESEQTQIGNYFQKLDSLINQHQQQITKLNNIKQACLSKMFV